MDIIRKVAFGEDLNIYDDDGDDKQCPFTKAVKCAMHGLAYAEEHPWDQFNPSKRARQFRRDLSESAQFIRDSGRSCIEKQLDLIRKGQPLTHNVLAHILQAACADADGLPEMEEMIDQFVTFFIAGQETTANLLTWTIKELTQKPQITYRLKTEVEAVLGGKSDIAFENLHKLEYTMAVLKESLRLYPPATGSVREAPNDCVFSGVKIPKGAIVVVLTYTMSRMEEYFKDPLTYDPDRFLHDEDKGMYAYFPFSLGPRSCIGQQFAMIEARVVLSKLLQNFEFVWVPGQSDGMIEEVTTKPKDGCKCYIKLASP
ncbi:cholesterol 24-hydroxylase-like [Amphiura filiformis]|uniref:cholesterol 24-hydroxylase-like n=1 Tax=Amphiura filiformis TaxID=82378 RepID=UPI003B218DEF